MFVFVTHSDPRAGGVVASKYVSRRHSRLCARLSGVTMKNALLVVVAVLGALGVLFISIYLLRKARNMGAADGAKSFRYVKLSQNGERVTESQCLVDVSTDEEDDEDDDDDESSPATIDVESRTAGVVRMNGQAAGYRKSALAENETDEELLQ